MNSITVRSAPEPIVPEPLEEAIRAYFRPTKEGRSAVEEFHGAVAKIPANRAGRVAALAAAYEMHLAQTVTREALDAWLEPLCDAVGQHPTEGAYAGRLSSVLLGAPDLPLACLNARSYSAAVRAFKWWPSAQELIDLLEREAAILRSRQRALQAVHQLMAPSPTIAAPPVQRVGPTEAELAAVSAMVSGFTAEVREREEDGTGADRVGKPPVRPSAVSPATLAAMLRRDIAVGPPDRVGGLRRRLELLEHHHPEVRE